MKTKKKILLLAFIGLIVLNLIFTTNTKQADVDLKQLANMAIASGEDDEEPIIEPFTSDWFLDLIEL